jgi:hypothetical protein
MNLPIKPASYTNPKEKERLLTQYAGIFPYNIHEFGQTIASKVVKKSKNYSR